MVHGGGGGEGGGGAVQYCAGSCVYGGGGDRHARFLSFCKSVFFFFFIAGEFSPVWLALSGNWVVVQLRSGRKADRMTNLHMNGRE